MVNKSDSPITTDNVNLSDLKYAVLVDRPDAQITNKPVSFYVRKPDRKGIKLTVSLYTTVKEL